MTGSGPDPDQRRPQRHIEDRRQADRPATGRRRRERSIAQPSTMNTSGATVSSALASPARRPSSPAQATSPVLAGLAAGGWTRSATNPTTSPPTTAAASRWPAAAAAVLAVTTPTAISQPAATLRGTEEGRSVTAIAAAAPNPATSTTVRTRTGVPAPGAQGAQPHPARHRGGRPPPPLPSPDLDGPPGRGRRSWCAPIRARADRRRSSVMVRPAAGRRRRRLGSVDVAARQHHRVTQAVNQTREAAPQLSRRAVDHHRVGRLAARSKQPDHSRPRRLG